jgi:putative nucleotidyltransferase with HDIG domain
MTNLIDHAAAIAGQLLPPLGNRWLHVQAVAERATEATVTVPEPDRDLLVAAAWLHDIGYAPSLAHTGFHPVEGARYLEQCGLPTRLTALVAHHSAALIEAQVRGIVAELKPWPLEDGPVTDALAYADMTTGPAGQRFTVDERIAEILTRYQPGHPVHRAISTSAPVLRDYCRRVEARLRSAGAAGEHRVGRVS